MCWTRLRVPNATCLLPLKWNLHEFKCPELRNAEGPQFHCTSTLAQTKLLESSNMIKYLESTVAKMTDLIDEGGSYQPCESSRRTSASQPEELEA